MLISEAYKEQNKQLHSTTNYGAGGYRWASSVAELCGKLGSQDVLDYGCGKKTLERALGFEIRNYDPCIEGLDAAPLPARVVVCTDVLEHIEPDHLDDVLDDLERVVLDYGFFVIANRAAKKTLPDGRNAHLIQEGPRWWLPKLCQRFEIVQVTNLGHEFVVLVKHA